MSPRLTREDVLVHPLRDALFTTIRNEPGIPFLELFRRFRADLTWGPTLGFGSLGFHLGKLEEHGFITTRKSGRHRRHYENGGAWNGDTSSLALVQASGAAALCAAVAARPGLNQYALWQLVSLRRPCTRQSIAYHLHRLERHGLVVMVRQAQSKTYVPTPLLLRLAPFASGLAVAS